MHKAKILIFSGVIFSFFVCICLSCTFEKNWDAITVKSKKAIVYITAADRAGTGFLISPNGLIITNSHVIGKAGKIEVTLHNKVMLDAKVINKGFIPFDIALIEIPGSDYDYLEFANSDKCANGEEVITIGFPSGKETVSHGVISNSDRPLDFFLNSNSIKKFLVQFKNIQLLQTNVSISPGNSGGPLINKKGKVVGVITWNYRHLWHKDFNLAISSNTAEGIINGNFLAVEQQLSEASEIYTDLADVYIKEYLRHMQNTLDTHVSRELLQLQMEMPLSRYPKDYLSLPDWLFSLSLKIQKNETNREEVEREIINTLQSKE
jgi:hypothetical protein